MEFCHHWNGVDQRSNGHLGKPFHLWTKERVGSVWMPKKKNVFHIQKTGATYSNSLRMRRFQPIPPPLFLLPQLLPTPPTPHRWYHPVPNVQSHLCQWQKDYHHLLAPRCAAPQVCFVPNSLVISSQNHFGRTQVHQNTTMASSFLLVKLEVLAGQKV